MEFSVGSDQFILGQVLSGPPTMRVALERVVPTGDSEIPFIWATGEDFESFEQKIRAHPSVDELITLERIGDSALYRVKWHGYQNSLIQAIRELEGTILEAQGDETWAFRLRFPDHDRLSTFYNFCTDHGIGSTSTGRTH